MSYYLKVTKRGRIMSNTRQLIDPGTKLSKDQCIAMFGGAAEVDRLVYQGYLVRIGEQNDPTEHILPPQTTTPPPHPAEIGIKDPAMETAARGAVANAPVVAGSIGAIITDTGPWDMDPAKITGRDIHELNVMIAERSGNEVPPFETVEEAIAWLSQDFKIESVNVTTT